MSRPNFRAAGLRLARPPLVSMVVAVALLAALTGASNHAPSGGDGAGQALAVGLAATGREAPVPAAGKSKTAAGAGTAAGAPATTAAGLGGQPTTTATTTLATAAAADDGGAAAAEPDPEPAPVRTRDTAPPATDPPPPPPPPSPAGLTRLPNVELEVLTLTNMDRGNNGAPPIYRDSCMDAEASAWAYAMAEANAMAHSGGGGGAVQGCRGAGAAWGDNIGYWQPCYASEMEAWWMGSPSHRPHIVDPAFTAVGIGVWAEPNGRCWFQVYFGT